MSRRNALLGEHVEVLSGPAFKSAHFSADTDDVPLVKGENIGQGQILWQKSKYWSRADLDSIEKYLLIPGDVIVAMDRPWVPAGLKWAAIQPHDPPALLVQRVARLRAQNGLRQDFLKYIIASPDFSKYVNSIMYGVNVPHISGKQIKAFGFLLPKETEQIRIASILSAYDDLIENNRRRIALLERAARELYREWFVRLRFPGHEHTKIVKGVPEGWKEASFAELADFVNGYAFKPAHLGEVGLPVVKIPELKNGVTAKTPKNPGDLVPSKYHIHDGDLLFSWSGTLAVNVWSSGDALLNQHLFLVIPTGRVSRAFLMFALREAHVSFENQTIGATMKHIRRSALDAVTLLLPDRPLLEEFERTLSGMWNQVINLQKQNGQLATARDLLLPRLMAGEVAV